MLLVLSLAPLGKVVAAHEAVVVAHVDVVVAAVVVPAAKVVDDDRLEEVGEARAPRPGAPARY